MAKKLSGLQRDVLSLYRTGLRAVRKKPPESRENFRLFLRKQFEDNRKLNKSDFSTIEYLLRRGRNQLEIYASPGVRNVAI
ncbi:complex 1 protein-domain-containing protein [Dipodascopsis uninucleata]